MELYILKRLKVQKLKIFIFQKLIHTQDTTFFSFYFIYFKLLSQKAENTMKKESSKKSEGVIHRRCQKTVVISVFYFDTAVTL